MFKLNNMKAPAGSNHAPIRKGRGIGSGKGKTAGKGHKGQKARSGGYVRAGFEGGQMPLYRKSPKVGFNSPLKLLAVSVNLTELSNFEGMTLSLKDLVPLRLSKNPRVKLSVFGTRLPESLPKSLEAHRVAPNAKELIASIALKVTLL